MLSFFLIIATISKGQTLNPDYFATYWLTANARAMGMGKSFAPAYNEPAAIMYGPTSVAGFNGFAASGGFALSPVPELNDASAFNLGFLAGNDSGLTFGVSHNGFRSGDFAILDPNTGIDTSNVRYSTTVVNLIYKGKKSGLHYGLNAEYFQVDDENVFAFGFGMAGQEIIRDDEKQYISFRYSAGLNGANIVLVYLARLIELEAKIPPTKGVIGASITQRVKTNTWGYRGVNAGIDLIQCVNYGNNTYVRIGGEVGLAKFLWVRTGFYLERALGNDLFYGPTGGLGLEIPLYTDNSQSQDEFILRLDWAIFPYPTFQESFVLPNQQPLTLPAGNSQILSATISVRL